MENTAFTVKLIPLDEIASVLPIFINFHPAYSGEQLLRLLTEMMEQGYQCAVAFDNDRPVGVIGLWIQTKFYIGKHIEYDNFYVLPSYRGRGVGKSLLKYVNCYAREQGCIAAELTCDIEENASQAFWKRMNFTTIGQRYQIALNKFAL